MTWSVVVLVVLAALGCAVAGAGVPRLVAAIPEPPYDAEDQRDGPKELYVDVAARPRLALLAALTCGVVGAAVAATVGSTWDLVLLLPLAPVGVALAVVDWRTRLLPSRVVWPAILVAVALGLLGWAVTGEPDDLRRAALGMAGSFLVFRLLHALPSAGLGYGDVRLSALLGFVLGHLGWAPLLVGTYAGFLVFGLPGLALAVVRRDRGVLKQHFPFGPFMLLGALVGVLLGDPVVGGLVGRGA